MPDGKILTLGGMIAFAPPVFRLDTSRRGSVADMQDCAHSRLRREAKPSAPAGETTDNDCAEVVADVYNSARPQDAFDAAVRTYRERNPDVPMGGENHLRQVVAPAPAQIKRSRAAWRQAARRLAASDNRRAARGAPRRGAALRVQPGCLTIYGRCKAASGGGSPDTSVKQR
jgi:hypothetical protein